MKNEELEAWRAALVAEQNDLQAEHEELHVRPYDGEARCHQCQRFNF